MLVIMTVLVVNILGRECGHRLKGLFYLLLFLIMMCIAYGGWFRNVCTIVVRTMILDPLLVVLWLQSCFVCLAGLNGGSSYSDLLLLGRMLQRVHSSMAGDLGGFGVLVSIVGPLFLTLSSCIEVQFVLARTLMIPL